MILKFGDFSVGNDELSTFFANFTQDFEKWHIDDIFLCLLKCVYNGGNGIWELHFTCVIIILFCIPCNLWGLP